MKPKTLMCLGKSLMVLLLVFSIQAFGENTITDENTTANEGVTTNSVTQHEIGLDAGTLLGYGANATGAGVYTDLDSPVYIGLSADYGYSLTPWLQFAANMILNYADSGSRSATIFQITAGPTLNFGGSDGLYDAFFISLMGGFSIADTSSAQSITDAVVRGTIGFRCKMFEHVNWKPNVGANKQLDGSKFLFAFRPVSFSIVF